MNNIFFCLFTAVLFFYPAKYSSNVNPHNNSNGIIAIISNDDVTMSYRDDKDENNNIIRRRYYLTNNTGTAKTITWSFADYYNCTASGGFSGKQFLIGYGYSDITTFTQVDKNKQWSDGSYTIKW